MTLKKTVSGSTTLPLRAIVNAPLAVGSPAVSSVAVTVTTASSSRMSIVALRLCFPTPDDEWPRTDDPVKRILALSARDTARAILKGLERTEQGHGFEAFGISGDTGKRRIDTTLAKDVLGWEPLDPSP